MEARKAIGRPTLDKGKYKQVILYILNSIANNPTLGKVKLFKLLYFIDFNHFETYKASVTGEIYRKKDFGPVPEHGDQVLLEMAREEWITISKRPVFDYVRHEFQALSEPTLENFTRYEIGIIDQVIQKWAMHTTREIVTASHGEVTWRAVEMGEEIPYTLVFYRSKVVGADTDEEPSDASLAF